jgi:hypothetical protein
MDLNHTILNVMKTGSKSALAVVLTSPEMGWDPLLYRLTGLDIPFPDALQTLRVVVRALSHPNEDAQRLAASGLLAGLSCDPGQQALVPAAYKGIVMSEKRFTEWTTYMQSMADQKEECLWTIKQHVIMELHTTVDGCEGPDRAHAELEWARAESTMNGIGRLKAPYPDDVMHKKRTPSCLPWCHQCPRWRLLGTYIRIMVEMMQTQPIDMTVLDMVCKHPFTRCMNEFMRSTSVNATSVLHRQSTATDWRYWSHYLRGISGSLIPDEDMIIINYALTRCVLPPFIMRNTLHSALIAF